MFATSGLSAMILGKNYFNEIALNEDAPAQAFIPQHLSPSLPGTCYSSHDEKQGITVLSCASNI